MRSIFLLFLMRLNNFIIDLNGKYKKSPHYSIAIFYSYNL